MNPVEAEHDLRVQFVAIVDEQLGNMSGESVTEFTQTEEFSTYEAIATLYQE